MGKSSRSKGRTYQSPKKARTGSNTFWYALAFIVVAGGVLAVALSRSTSQSTLGPLASRGDHWHAALGVQDCGTWVPNWAWPPGNVTSSSAVGAGAPARAGSGGLIYAGLHSHGDGLIHMEPSGTEDEGKNATLGRYFQYGGWKLSQTSINFVNVNEKNGNTCNGKPGVLRWVVNGKEMHGNPAKYKLYDGDAIELVFTNAGGKLPPQSQIPSYAGLQSILNGGATTAPAVSAPGATQPGVTSPGQTTAPAATTTSAPAASTTGATTTSTP